MGSVTTAFPTSFKAELPVGTHNFTATTGNDFRLALIKAAPTGTYGAGSTNYSNITGNTDEVTGTGYTAGGYDFTAAQNITPTASGTVSIWSWNVNPSWAGATFTTDGCMIYNNTASQRAVYVGSFGSTQTVTAGTFTVILPANTAGNAILQLT
jgi:hypothetical protein